MKTIPDMFCMHWVDSIKPAVFGSWERKVDTWPAQTKTTEYLSNPVSPCSHTSSSALPYRNRKPSASSYLRPALTGADGCLVILTDAAPDENNLNRGETATKGKLPLTFRTITFAFKVKDCPFKVWGEQNARDKFNLAQNNSGPRANANCLEAALSHRFARFLSGLCHSFDLILRNKRGVLPLETSCKRLHEVIV